MNNNLEKAIELLKTENCTLAAVSSEKKITSFRRGVKPLLELIDAGQDLHGFSVADKVIGKAAAFLYVHLSPNEIYTNVISRSALSVMEKNHIRIHYAILAEAIRNRDNSGFCPMETAVMSIDDPNEALEKIRETLKFIEKKSP